MNITAHLGDTGISLGTSFLDTLRDTFKGVQATPATPATTVTVDPVIAHVYAEATKIHDLLKARGISEPGASYATYQVYFETGAFSSPLYIQHNNASGIKFEKQKGAVQGANGYAYWPDGLDGWADAFKHEITKGANPAGAVSLEDYVARLKKNSYMEASAASYLTGLQRARLVLKILPAADRASVQADGSVQDKQDMDIPGTKNEALLSLENKWKALPTMEKVGIGAGAAVLLILIFKD